ncbi:MAG: CHRD domain-containing protein [Bacteroidota bacterium]
MKPNNIIRISIVALLAVTVAGISSCKKEEDKILRSKSYTMSTYDNSGISGTVEFKENENGSTTIHTHMMGTMDGLSYPAHIHNGPITAPGGVNIDLGPFASSGGMTTSDKTVTNDYDEMIAFNGCFVAHNPQAADPLTSYVLVGNIGSNAP